MIPPLQKKRRETNITQPRITKVYPGKIPMICTALREARTEKCSARTMSWTMLSPVRGAARGRGNVRRQGCGIKTEFLANQEALNFGSFHTFTA